MKKNLYLIIAASLMFGTVNAQNVGGAKYPATQKNVKSASSSRQLAQLPELTKASNRNSAVTVDTLVNHFMGTPTLYTGATGGFVAGHNGYNDLAKMQKFDANYGVLSTGSISELLFWFGAKEGDPTGIITVKIWDDNAGQPGTVIGSADLTLADIDTTGNFTSVMFTSPVTIPANKIFYAGFSMTYTASDTVGLVTTSDGDFPAALTHTWEEWSDNTYHTFGDPANWDLGIALAVFPVVNLDSVVVNPGLPFEYYSENFDNGLSDGFAIFDEDGQAVAANVASIFTNAWVIAVADGSPTTDSSILSTSWYTPAGTSDDWAITPAIAIPASATTVELSWEGEAIDPAYPDGYEVYVSTTTQTVAACMANPAVYSTAGEDPAPTPRTVDLSSFAGQSVYIGFRNNSTDKFILSIDDIKVKGDVDFTSGVNHQTLNADVAIYPNPSKGAIQLNISNTTAQSFKIEVVNVLGQVVRTVDGFVGANTIDLSTEANGFYFVKIQSGDSSITKKVVLTK